VGTYFQLCGGRIETTKIFSTLNFFGDYSLGGQKYVDMAGFTFPMYLTAGIPEIDEVKFPPIALSIYVIPTIFDAIHTSYAEDQTLFLGQGRVNTILFDCSAMVIFIISKSITQYFQNNLMNGNITAEGSISVDMAKHYQINATYAVLNTTTPGTTSVAAGGLELHNFSAQLFVIDKIILEGQLILNESTSQAAWFACAENKIAKFRYGAAVSNTINQFTFGNVYTINPTLPWGQGNTYAPENISFDNDNTAHLSYYIYAGYDF